MAKNRWLVLAAIGQLLFFVVTAAPHAVHHGLHDNDSQECPISATTTQTTGNVPDILPLPSPLVFIDALPPFDLIPPTRLALQVYRSRAPPVKLPA